MPGFSAPSLAHQAEVIHVIGTNGTSSGNSSKLSSVYFFGPHVLILLFGLKGVCHEQGLSFNRTYEVLQYRPKQCFVNNVFICFQQCFCVSISYEGHLNVIKPSANQTKCKESAKFE